MLSQNNQQMEQKISEKVFSFSQLGCAVHNRQSVKRTESKQAKTEKVINSPSECQDNIIHKFFELQFAHHVVTIEDTFTLFFPLPGLQPVKSHQLVSIKKESFQSSDHKEQNKKVVLFRSSARGTGGKGDKKNIVKNVVMAFHNYLKDLQQEGLPTDSNMDQLRTLTKRNNFNNHLVTEIIANRGLRSYFKDFLSQSARYWVHNSKLKNKEIHEEAINLYERLCDEREADSQHANPRPVKQSCEMENDDNEFYFQSGINHELQQQISKFK